MLQGKIGCTFFYDTFDTHCKMIFFLLNFFKSRDHLIETMNTIPSCLCAGLTQYPVKKNKATVVVFMALRSKNETKKLYYTQKSYMVILVPQPTMDQMLQLRLSVRSIITMCRVPANVSSSLYYFNHASLLHGLHTKCTLQETRNNMQKNKKNVPTI